MWYDLLLSAGCGSHTAWFQEERWGGLSDRRVVYFLLSCFTWPNPLQKLFYSTKLYSTYVMKMNVVKNNILSIGWYEQPVTVMLFHDIFFAAEHCCFRRCIWFYCSQSAVGQWLCWCCSSSVAKLSLTFGYCLEMTKEEESFAIRHCLGELNGGRSYHRISSLFMEKSTLGT